MVTNPDVVPLKHRHMIEHANAGGPYGDDISTEDDFKSRGISKFGRVEIGLRHKDALASAAEHLRVLANRLEVLGRERSDRPLHSLMLEAQSEIIRANQMVKNATRYRG